MSSLDSFPTQASRKGSLTAFTLFIGYAGIELSTLYFPLEELIFRIPL